MYCNFKALNEQYGISQIDMAKAMGVSRNTFKKWRDTSEVPANQYYMLHKKYPKIVSLPSDFLDYTPFLIGVNIKIYGKTQKDLARAIGKEEFTISQMFKKNDSFYDYKEDIDKLLPVLCIPCVRNEKGKFEDVRKKDIIKNLDLTKLT